MKNNKRRRNTFVRNIPYLILLLPTLIYVFIFNYLPMAGTVLAFKRFNYRDGIFKSPWNGIENFKFFFTSQDALRITRNTVGYAVLNIVLGMIASVILALLLYEVTNRKVLKAYQTIMILPHFISWVVAAFIMYVLLNPMYGVLNTIMESLGMETINWYSNPRPWPVLIVLSNIWKGVGMSSIIYYASLMGVDSSLFEAARIDGASKMQQIRYVSIPSLVPIITILLIMSVGGIMRGDFGLFYQVPMDSGALYSTTDIIDTYVYRGLKGGSFEISSAVGLFQSVVGLVMVLTANSIVKKLEPDNSMF